MDPSDSPPFLDGTFLWTEHGYAYAAPPPQPVFDPETVVLGDPWLSLAAALECAKRGEHDPVGELGRWLSSGVEGGVIQSCLCLIGDAGRETHMALLLEAMQPSLDEYWRIKACEAAAHSGYLSLVPDILEVSRTVRRAERGSLSLYLSWLLDPPGRVEVGDELAFEDDDAYLAFVSSRALELAKAHPDARAFFRGEPLNVEALARRMLQLLTPVGDRFERDLFSAWRHRFEACTGVDCRAMYDGGELRPLGAAAILEDFVQQTDFRRYVPGQRYFWGHVIP